MRTLTTGDRNAEKDIESAYKSFTADIKQFLFINVVYEAVHTSDLDRSEIDSKAYRASFAA